MSQEKQEPHPDQPMIRFGDEWLPAHEVWAKMETANVVVAAIHRFNEQFPDLASTDTRSVVPLVRQRLKDIQLRMPAKTALPSLQGVAAGLLADMSPEEAIADLADKHGTRLDMRELIQLAGEQAYLHALHREATEYELNRISCEQMAELWNDAGRPAPGGGLWSGNKVCALLSAGA